MSPGGPNEAKAKRENAHSEEPSGIGRAMSREKPIRKPWRDAHKNPSPLPQAAQNRVVVASAAGRSHRESSRELGLSRNNIARVLLSGAPGTTGIVSRSTARPGAVFIARGKVQAAPEFREDGSRGTAVQPW